MKPTPLRLFPLLAVFCLLSSYASAHPGHGDDHDFSWDFGHLAAHPVATVAWLAVFGAAAWAVFRFARTVQGRDGGR